MQRGVSLIIKKLLFILIVLILILNVFAADPGHIASSIGPGEFETGNYTFPDTLHIENYFNVSGLLWVDPITNKVGIGTTSPTQELNVIGDLNVTEGINLSMYKGCTALETDAQGNLICGSDDTGATTASPFQNDSQLITPIDPNLNFSYDSGVLYIDSGNNRVGVNTVYPTTSLDVVSTGNTRLFIRSTSGADALAGIKLAGRNTGADYAWYIDSRAGTGTPLNRFSILNNLLEEKFTITSEGNVGIGTTSPGDAKLNVTGTIDAWQVMVNGTPISASNGDLSNYALTNESETFTENITAQDSLISTKAIYGPGQFTVTGSGDVGIGTATPGAKLDIRSDTTDYSQLHIGDADGVVTIGGNNLGQFIINGGRKTDGTYATTFASEVRGLNGDLLLKAQTGLTAGAPWSSPTTRITIKGDSGNVGIGTTSPTTELDVAGNINVTGAVPYIHFGKGGYMYDNGTALIIGHS